jgi:glutathione S-transferase
MQLIIGNKNYSSWSLRPWLLLSMHELPFEEIVIPLYRDDSSQKIYRYNAAGKVPVLIDHELRVWDSLAICEYISEHYLENLGWPSDIATRALARSVSAEMHSGFTALRSYMPMNCRARGRYIEITAEINIDIQRIVQIWSELRQQFAKDGPWLFGTFSIADCMFAPVVCRFVTFNVEVPQVCKDYMLTMLSTDAMQLWLRQAELESEVIIESEVGIAT